MKTGLKDCEVAYLACKLVWVEGQGVEKEEVTGKADTADNPLDIQRVENGLKTG